MTWTIAGLVVFTEVIGRSNGFGGEQGVKSWYIPVVLAYVSFLSVLLQLSVSSFDVVYPIAVIMVLYLFFLVFGRPYSSVIHTLGSIACHLVSMFAIALIVVYRAFSVSEEYEVLLLFVL